MLVTAIAPSGTELKQIELGDNVVLCLPGSSTRGPAKV